ncbi:LuxR family transcriptional regulator [Winogradskya consettensis]|uniref:Helix-turn-helix transcriptional regulator n=1 Tax=Winogradskya consettensis TaxID=113560 RepID=A0A919VTY3_9ACTN|nr:LuxR family transcriptional regulator [Actinoplanes consettensis]GIM76481.1 helix-turn-helix transcriptional regulator [Actinoplanes consettensis]
MTTRSTSPPLRGRDAERAVLRGRVHQLIAGTGGVVIVEGVPGSGKSSLIADAGDTGRERDAQVLTGAGQIASLGVPAWLLLDTLTSTDEPPVDLDALRRAAERTEGGFWLVQEVHDGLEKATLHTPVMIVIDDFQWADLATAAAVRTLTRRLSADPVLWVIALRPDPPAPVRAVIDQMSGQGAEVLRLGALDADAIAQVTRDVLGGTPDPGLREALAGAQGRPLLLLDLLHGLRDEHTVELRGGVAALRGGSLPRRFRDSIREQVRLLSDDGRLTVEMASILGRTFTAEQLAGMLDRRPSALLAPLREALDAELIIERGDTFAFRHDLVREAIDAGLPEPLRRALRRQAIEAGLAGGTPVAEIAALVLQIATHGDAEAIGLLRRAAAESLVRSSAIAAELSSQAFALVRWDDPGRGTMLTEAVTHLVLADRALDAAELFERGRGPALAPMVAAQIQRLIAEAILPADAGRAAQLCREALTHGNLPAELRARLYAVLSGALGIIGRPTEARQAADAAVAASRAGIDARSVSAVLVAKAVADFQLCDWSDGLRSADDAIRLRIETSGAHALSLPDGWKAMMLDAAGRMGEAWRLAEEGARLAQLDGQLANARVWAMIRARITLRSGRLDEARAEAEAIQAMSYELGSVSYLYVAALTLATVAIHRGDQAGMRVADAMAAHMGGSGNPDWRGRGQWLRALLDEARGLPAGEGSGDEMATLFSGCVRVVTLTEHAEVGVLVRLLLRAGRRDLAETAVARLTDESHRHAGEPVVEAALHHARGLLTADPGLLLRAVDLHAGDERPLVRARVSEDAGTVVVATDRSHGLSLLGSAIEQWEAVGADRDAARVRQLLRRYGVRRRTPYRPRNGWAGLTESETKVARMVARGWTNRQVADELFLSPHTVSSHLRHAFGKLGVRSRVELARLVLTADHEV